jgi:hypothetical protein
MTTTTPYTVRTGSLAHSVLSFFIKNPDEALDQADLVTKYGAQINSIPKQLEKARTVGAIVRNGGLYMLGDIKTAKRCLEEEPTPATSTATAPAVPAPAPAPTPTPKPTMPAPTKSAAPAARGTNATSVTVPGFGTMKITFEPLACRLAVSGYKWDPVLDHLADQPISAVEGEVATIRLPKAMGGAAKAGIESWHKRHANRSIRFRASVSGEETLIQRIA